jgi:hypothetical protein
VVLPEIDKFPEPVMLLETVKLVATLTLQLKLDVALTVNKSVHLVPRVVLQEIDKSPEPVMLLETLTSQLKLDVALTVNKSVTQQDPMTVLLLTVKLSLHISLPVIFSDTVKFPTMVACPDTEQN